MSFCDNFFDWDELLVFFIVCKFWNCLYEWILFFVLDDFEEGLCGLFF